MTSIANAASRLALDPRLSAAGFWPTLAQSVADWCAARALNPRDLVLLLPYAGLLPAARAAFARRGGWQPRIETTRTLAASLAPPRAAAAGQISFDTVTDRLSAAALLRAQASGAAWARRDVQGFEAAVASLVDTAHALLREAQARAPAQRDAFWSGWRDALVPVTGPGASERWLARIALEWAAAADAPTQDLLWSHRPAAWLALQAGGPDAFAQKLLAAAQQQGIPVLWLDADPPAFAPFDALAELPPPRRWLCDGFEGEAQAAALAVLEALDAQRTSAASSGPVALIAQDRLVVRRIRALLERADVALRDETGWTLSTTRSAARLVAMLRAADPHAGRDALLDALKAEGSDSGALLKLEAAWRRDAVPDARAMALLDDLAARLQPLRLAARRPLAAWLQALAAAVPMLLRELAQDAAGRPLLAALHLDGGTSDAAWSAAAQGTQFDLAGFANWVEAALEAASFLPPAGDNAAVVIVPLASAMLRPFAAVVMPGCDHLHLGAASVAPGLLPEALLRDFGMPGAQAQRERERLAFAHLLRAPRVTLLRRRSQGSEPLAPSLLVEYAWQARRRLAQPAPDEAEVALPQRSIQAAPTPRPAPSAAQALPPRLSASAVDNLRACPYRFFALSMLGLREAPELEAELEKRDYGTWLHGVLQRFHGERPASGAAASDAQRLRDAADTESESLGLDAAQLLPFRAGFESFAASYLAWLHRRDAEGWCYGAGEISLQLNDPRLQGVQLDGRIDRIDHHATSGENQLIDYKTGSAQALRGKVAEPLEDTQLAFYAALLASVADEQPVSAIYLALEDRKPPQAIAHPHVADSAELLIEGLAHDFAQVRAGAGLPALGEGSVCDFCEVRGLCRKDHWSELSPP